MLDDLQISALRTVPRIGYYFRYPLHRKDFHAFRKQNRIRGHYAAKPLYGQLTETGHVDRSAGFNGDVATLFVPLKAQTPEDVELLIGHTAPEALTLPSGKKNWDAIRHTAEKSIHALL